VGTPVEQIAVPPMKPEVTQVNALDMQVCVPDHWTDEQVLEFAESENPNPDGWHIRHFVDGEQIRVKCGSRTGCVHIMLDA
jgi:hypothetical protein